MVSKTPYGRHRPRISELSFIISLFFNMFQKGHIVSEEMKRKTSGNLGKKHSHSEETKRKMSLSHIGKSTGKHSGEKCNWWKGGITPKNQKIRQSFESKLWRKTIFERDNFICQKYGIKGGELAAHHINNFADFPELRFAIDNGITLSKKAHQEFHKKYGTKQYKRTI